ncbi:MAG: Fis family transcriptional regulator [Candidatus Omnitrophota bacterium]|jgi:two-component system nitrogen regulation response regulator GlnG|nr:MAG: Fis family transcriptional regulator [Candidatus Omnitrophota bacterium]
MMSLETSITQLGNLLLGDKSGHLYRLVLEKVEKPLFEHILTRTAGNQLRAAKILGINRNTMRSKIKKLGIQIEKYRLGHG